MCHQTDDDDHSQTVNVDGCWHSRSPEAESTESRGAEGGRINGDHVLLVSYYTKGEVRTPQHPGVQRARHAVVGDRRARGVSLN